MKRRFAELLILLVVCSLILAVSSLPNWVGRSLENEEVSFRGQYFDTQDYAVDIAMMRAGMQGDWAYQMRFTTEEHPAAYIRLFYLALGHVTRVLGMEPEPAYHLFRWIFGYLALFAIFYLCRIYFEKKSMVWMAFLLAVFGSGLGWLQLLAGWQIGTITPVDFWLIDAYVLFSISLFPHFSCTLALMAAGLTFYLKFLKDHRWRYVIFTALAAILCQCVNPIAFVVVDAAILFATLFTWFQNRAGRKKLVLALGVVGLAQLPLLIYNVGVLSRDPVWSRYTAQNITLSPSPLHYLFGFGLLWLLLIPGIVVSIKEKKPHLLGLIGWLVCAFALAYSPTLIQRRFLLGVTLPMAILGAQGLDVLIQRMKVKKPLAALAVLVLCSLSSIYLIYGNVQLLKGLPAEAFYPAGMDEAFSWLTDNADPDDFVLGAETTGQLTAQKTGLRVYLGHEMETVNYEAKIIQVASWYQRNFPPEALKGIPVEWVIYSPYEEAFNPQFQPGDNLKLVFDEAGVRIYSIQ